MRKRDFGKNGNIDYIVHKHLCTSCGACAGICPSNSISMQINSYGIFVPIRNEFSCNRCSLCLQVCPGYSFDYMAFQHRLFGKIPENIALGNFISTHAGYSNDEQILSMGQSGGLVSTLLIYCLDRGIIDGAVVTRWNKDSPLKANTYIAKDREAILAATGSKYHPVPACQIIRDLLRSKGHFAFVGTPCHIQGMRKSEKLIPKLQNKIVLYIGVHCLGVFTYHFQDQILHKFNLNKKDLTYFHYRDKLLHGWPGDMLLKDNKGNQYDIDKNASRIWPRYHFTNWRCFLCFDKTNEFSDLSCGDCRIPEVKTYYRKKGYNLRKGLSDFIIRTERADCIVKEAINKGILSISSIEPNAMASSLGVAGKKIGLNTFSKISLIFGAGVPKYGIRFSIQGVRSSLFCALSMPFNILFSSHYFVVYSLMKQNFTRHCMKQIPHIFLGGLSLLRYIFCDWAKFGKTSFLILNKKEDSFSKYESKNDKDFN